jgi:hypothetical protein
MQLKKREKKKGKKKQKKSKISPSCFGKNAHVPEMTSPLPSNIPVMIPIPAKHSTV